MARRDYKTPAWCSLLIGNVSLHENDACLLKHITAAIKCRQERGKFQKAILRPLIPSPWFLKNVLPLGPRGQKRAAYQKGSHQEVLSLFSPLPQSWANGQECWNFWVTPASPWPRLLKRWWGRFTPALCPDNHPNAAQPSFFNFWKSLTSHPEPEGQERPSLHQSTNKKVSTGGSSC